MRRARSVAVLGVSVALPEQSYALAVLAAALLGALGLIIDRCRFI